jgi:hypothetical protein
MQRPLPAGRGPYRHGRRRILGPREPQATDRRSEISARVLEGCASIRSNAVVDAIPGDETDASVRKDHPSTLRNGLARSNVSVAVAAHCDSGRLACRTAGRRPKDQSTRRVAAARATLPLRGHPAGDLRPRVSARGPVRLAVLTAPPAGCREAHSTPAVVGGA